MNASETPTVMADLQSKVRSQSKPDANGCWIWQRSINSRGYGQAWNGKLTTAHRMSYQAFFGDPPPGHYICHRCDNKTCVNPDHLFAGTPSENLQDAYDKGRKGVLSISSKKKLLAMIQRGASHREIGSRFGVSQSVAWYWKKRISKLKSYAV